MTNDFDITMNHCVSWSKLPFEERMRIKKLCTVDESTGTHGELLRRAIANQDITASDLSFAKLYTTEEEQERLDRPQE